MKHEYKIGAQVLSPSMMEYSFFHTDAVLNTIESIRETASKTHAAFSNKLRNTPNEALMDARGYNNAISILGSRGSGKTSIIMTLQYILQVGEAEWRAGKHVDQVQPENIIMPILMPQDFSDGQSLLSWVIIKLQELAKAVLEKAKNSGYGFCWANGTASAWETGEKPSPYNALQEYIDNLTVSYELRFRNEYRLEATRNEEIYHYMDSVGRDSDLVLDMLKLVSTLVDCYRLSQEKGSGLAREPLVFFVIDDLDMAPQRSHEILNLILRFLQHPNIVVLCGWNQELFQNHLCTELLKSQGVLSNNSADKNYGFDDIFTFRQRKRLSALDSARRLAMDNLKKAFPPAQRFEIRGLTTEQRAEFPLLSENELPTDPKDFFALIENTLLYSRKNPPTDGDHVGFLYNENNERLLVYMRIFDNKCRGMINICKAFEALREKLLQWDHESSLDITKDVSELLNTILFSTTRFALYRRGIRDLVSINKITLSKGKGNADYFCNYKAVDEVLNHYNDSLGALARSRSFDYEYRIEQEYCYFPSLVIDIYLLLDFMENLMRYLVRSEPVMHGGHEFSRALNQINPPIIIEPESDDRIKRTIASAGIQEISLFPDTRSFAFNVRLLDSYEKQRFSDKQYYFSGSNTLRRLFDAIFNMGLVNGTFSVDAIKSFYDQDHLWFSTIIDLLRASRATNDNIERLNRYTSFQAQRVFSGYSEFDRIAATPVSQSFLSILNNNRYQDKSVSDSEMNDLVFCLRETDKLRKDFTVFQTLLGKKTNPDSETQSRTVRKAALYLGLISESETNARGQKRWISPSQYKRKLETVNAGYNYYKEDQVNLFPEQTVSLAKDLSDKSIELLMFNLKRRLEIAVCRNYKQQGSLGAKYRYLLKASSAVTEYLRDWNLIDYGWTEEDAEAARDLLGLLREKHIDDLYITAKRISDLGPMISHGGRDLYNSYVEDVKSRIGGRLDNYSEAEVKRIRNDLQILSDAPTHIRRSLIVEADIFELLIDFWHTLIDGAASHAIDLRKEEKTYPVVWPIETQCQDVIEKWCLALEPVILKPMSSSTTADSDKTQKPGGRTRFDAVDLF